MTFTLDRARLVEDVAVSGTGFISFETSVPNSGKLTVGGRGTAPGTIALGGDSVFDNTQPTFTLAARSAVGRSGCSSRSTERHDSGGDARRSPAPRGR